MLIAAAVVPHPPVLVPGIAGGFAPDLDPLRAACEAAIDRLYAARAEELLVVGLGPASGGALAATGSFREYGLDLPVDGRWTMITSGVDTNSETNRAALPLPFLIGAWLLRDRPAEPPRRAVPVGGEGTVDSGVLEELAATETRQAMLVLGDGSASRTPQAPGHFDERAEPYDAAVAEALAAADTKALAALDPELSRQLHVAGLPAWQALAAAADVSGIEYDGEVLYDEAPYGVGYFVATWLAR